MSAIFPFVVDPLIMDDDEFMDAGSYSDSDGISYEADTDLLNVINEDDSKDQTAEFQVSFGVLIKKMRYWTCGVAYVENMHIVR